MTTQNTATQYCVWWCSPRGVANEGSYVYGSAADVVEALICEELCGLKSEISLISEHRTFDAAQLAAINHARRDYKKAPKHDICGYCVINAAKFLTRR